MVLTRPAGGRYLCRVGDDHGVFGCPRAPKVPPCASKLRSARVMAQPAATPATEAAKAAPAPVTARSKRVQGRSVQAFSQFVRSQDHFSNHTTSQIDVLKQDLKAVDQLQARLLKKITELKLAALPTTFSASPPPPSEAEPIGFPVTYAVIHNVSKFLGGEGDRVLPTRVCKAWLKCRGPPRPMRRVTQIVVHLHNTNMDDPRPKWQGSSPRDITIDAIEFLYDDGTAKTWGTLRPVPQFITPPSFHILEDDELVAIETYVCRPSRSRRKSSLESPHLYDIVFLTRRGIRLDPKLKLRHDIQLAASQADSVGPVRDRKDDVSVATQRLAYQHLDILLPYPMPREKEPEIHRLPDDGPITYITADYHHSCCFSHTFKLAGIASVGDSRSLPGIRHVGTLPGERFEFDKL